MLIPIIAMALASILFFSPKWMIKREQSSINNDNLGSIVAELSGKFLFSVIGIFFAIVWNFIIKDKLSTQERAEKANDYMQENPHEILYKMRNIIQCEAARQTTAQMKAQTQLDIIAENTSELSEILEKITEIAVDADIITKKIKSVNVETTTIGANTKAISTNSAQQVSELSEMLKIMKGAGKSLQTVLDNLQNALQKNIKAMGEKASHDTAVLHAQFQTFLKERMEPLSETSAQEIKGVKTKIHSTLEALTQNTQTNTTTLNIAIQNIEKTLAKLETNLAAIWQIRRRFTKSR